MQSIVKDDHGTVRFRANSIVSTLLDASQARGFGLNQLSTLRFPQTDWEQFYQLIGYSVSGYHELSQISDVSALAATKAAQKIAPETGGCRDDNCSVHCGVEIENDVSTR